MFGNLRLATRRGIPNLTDANLKLKKTSASFFKELFKELFDTFGRDLEKGKTNLPLTEPTRRRELIYVLAHLTWARYVGAMLSML